jgi:hypothetical protein
MNTPAPNSPSPRAALSARAPLKASTLADRQSPLGGVLAPAHPCATLLAAANATLLAGARWLSMPLCASLVACSSAPSPPDWQVNAKSNIDRAAEAGLRGDSRIEATEFARARAEVARTGQPTLVARVELMRCATRVASLDFVPCIAFDPLAGDAAPPEQAYARYLAGQATPADAALLPLAHRSLASEPTAPDAALSAITDPLSQLIAAGVLLRRNQATPSVIEQAINTASSQGWRRPLLAWLGVAQQRAQAAGVVQEAARIQRRIDLVLPSGR